MSTSYGCRVPTLAFLTGGVGQSNQGIPPQEYETFAYDSALLAAGIENFNVVPYTSVLPKELDGNIIENIKEVDQDFHHGAVLEVIMAGHGANRSDTAALATGLGVCWAQDPSGRFVGGFAAEYIQQFTAEINEDIAYAQAVMWLNTSMDHELKIRGLEKRGEYSVYVNWLNIEQRFAYCLTAMGFLNFTFLDPVVIPPK
jgi:arginine decarboxylase